MSDWLQTVIQDHGLWCPSCDSAWRILKADDSGSLRIVEDCYGCSDEAFDIYDVETDGP